MILTEPATRSLITLPRLIIAVALIIMIQLVLGYLLDLYSDEIFYWQASTHPALAYSDLPFMTALLAGMGAMLAPGQALAVRLPFIMLGGIIPFLLLWVARPVTNRQQALESAALSLCLPLGGFLGLLAVPDVPLIFFGLLSLGFFERALRTDKLPYWLAAGTAAALGFSTHYRFLPYAVAVLVFAWFFQRHGQLWRRRGFLLAVSISCLGLLPIIWFNLKHDLSSLGFYFIDRHPWDFQPEGLLHVFKQAFLVTPPLYAVLVFTLWTLFQDARSGNQVSALFLCLAAVNAGIYLVLAPWTDSTSTSIHWPLSGYFPLLVFAPRTLRKVRAWFEKKSNALMARRVTLAIPVLGLIGTMVAFVGIGSQAFPNRLPALAGTGLLSDKMSGWQEFTQHTDQILIREFGSSPVPVVTDNYYTAAQLQFAANTPLIAFNIDADKAIRDGRAAQYAIWRENIDGLGSHRHQDGLFITEDSTLTIPDKYQVLRTMCEISGEFRFLEQLSLFNGLKRFSYYRFGKLLDESNSDGSGTICPYPPQGWIDTPLDGDEVSGNVNVSGWVFSEDVGIRSVTVLLNGEEIGQATYGIPRTDVVDAMQVDSDPGRPGLGFQFVFDSRFMPDGKANLALVFENMAGERQQYGQRTIIIGNP